MISLVRVLLPQPVRPTIATVWPDEARKDTFFEDVAFTVAKAHVVEHDLTRIGAAKPASFSSSSRTIAMPEQPANLAWGGPHYDTLYITATHGLYKLRTKTKGFVPYLAAHQK